MKTTAILLAAGNGNRFGSGSLKQFVNLNGKSLLQHTVDAFRAAGVSQIIAVIPKHSGTPDAAVPPIPSGSDVLIVEGGNRRGLSIQAGMLACNPSTEIVLIHDAARPLISTDLIHRSMAALMASPDLDAVVPALGMDDSFGEVGEHCGGVLLELASDKSKFRRLQTPETARFPLLREAMFHTDCMFDTAIEAAFYTGLLCGTIPGDPFNLKITHPPDLFIAERIQQWREAETGPVDLYNKQVLLIGSSGGIGSEVARQLKDAKAQVFPLTREYWDLTKPMPQEMQWLLTSRPWDAIVHAAGVLTENYEEAMSVHLRSVVELCGLAPNAMPNGGSIVVLGSSAASHGRTETPIYAASKAALNNYVEGIAPRLARHGIQINSVNPCRVKTQMRLESGLPLEGAVDVEKVARAVLSHCATEKTGQVVQVRP